MFSVKSRTRVTFSCGSELMTKQSHKNECDINNILTQFKRTGIIQHISQQTPIYADLPSDIDYQQALHTQMQADQAFSTLPSVVRAHFNNDPAALLEALGDPGQKDKLIELGILKPPPAPQPPGNPDNVKPVPPTGGELVQHPERL